MVYGSGATLSNQEKKKKNIKFKREYLSENTFMDTFLEEESVSFLILPTLHNNS